MDTGNTADPFPGYSHQEVLDGLAWKVNRLDETILKARNNTRRQYLRARAALDDIAERGGEPAKARAARRDINNALIEFEELTNTIARHHERTTGATMSTNAILKIAQLTHGQGFVDTSHHALPWRSLAFDLPHLANWLDMQDLDSATQLALSANAEPPSGLGATPLNRQEHTAAARDHGPDGPHANIFISVTRPGAAEIEIETRSQDGTHWTDSVVFHMFAGDDTREPHAIAARHIQQAIHELETTEDTTDPDVESELEHHYAQLQDQEARARSFTNKPRSQREADLSDTAAQALPLLQAIAKGALIDRADAQSIAATAARITTYALDLTGLIPHDHD